MVALSTFKRLALVAPCLLFPSEAQGATKEGSDLPLPTNRDLQFSDSELQYLSECENTFLGEAVIEDGLISQQDFANAYQGFCSKFSVGADCPSGRFATLPSRLQFLFFEAVCETMPFPEQCVKRLNTLNTMAFGYIVSEETASDIQMHVERLCLEMLDHVFITKAPTVVPIGRFPYTSPPAETTSELDIQIPNDETVDLPSDQVPAEQSSSNQSTGNQPREPAVVPPDNKSESPLDLPAEEEDMAPTNEPSDKFVASSGNSFSNGPIIGIAATALACILMVVFVAHRRRQAQLDDKNLKHVSCDSETSSDTDPEAPGSYPDALVIKKNQSISAFDASGAAAIALNMSSDASSVSRSDFGRGFSFPANRVSMREIEEAVDNGNWDEVYKLASHLAEQEDLSTLSSFGRQSTVGRLSKERIERRAQLREEDHERVKTLDELIDSRDWTGVAVTAALYAGESGYKKQDSPPRGSLFSRVTGQRVSNAAREASSQDVATPVYQNSRLALGAPTIDSASETTEDVEAQMEGVANSSSFDNVPLVHLKHSMDHAVDAGDWDQVLRISSEVEKNGEFQSRLTSQTAGVVVSTPSNVSSTSNGESAAAFKTLLEEMDRAMNRGDWALVGFYADKIRGLKISDDEVNPEATTSRALVPFTPPVISSARTEDSISSKKSTLEKLVQAQKWKGVSIMAGLYEMEAKGSFHVEPEFS